MYKFWQGWVADYKILAVSLLIFFVASMVCLFYPVLMGNSIAIDWSTFQEQKSIESIIHQFDSGPYLLSIPAENYILYEYLQGSNMDTSDIGSLIALAGLMIGFIVLVSILTTLDNFWFYVGSALAIIFIVSLQLDVLMLFGIQDKFIIPAFAIGLYAIPIAFFRYFNRSTAFVYRILVFTLITTGIGIVVAYGATVMVPFFHLTLTSYPAALIITVFFIFCIGHEIPVAFVYLTNQGKGNSVSNLIVITVIYLINVFLGALHEAEIIKWNFLFLNPYLLLGISAVLGIYGFLNREKVYAGILDLKPLAAFYYLALGGIALFTISGYAFTLNDSALKIIRDMIMFSHFGFGLAFLLYFLANFLSAMGQNLKVWKVLYEPRFMPWFTYRFAGVIIVLALAIYAGQKEYYYEAFAGFYSYAGDLHEKLGNEDYAVAFHENSVKSGFRTHRSNYLLGTYRAGRNEFQTAITHFDAASTRRPSEYSLINLGNTYIKSGANTAQVPEIFASALKIMPSSGPLHNNFAIALLKNNQSDSAIASLDFALNDSHSSVQAQTNFFALLVAQGIKINVDSVLNALDISSPGPLANAMILANLGLGTVSKSIPPPDTIELNVQQATLLNNVLLHQPGNHSASFLEQVDKVTQMEVNAPFSEAIRSNLAHAYYMQGKVNMALEIMSGLIFQSTTHLGRYNYIQGLWALEQLNPELAASYFAYSGTQQYKYGQLFYAMALTEAGNLQAALPVWDTLAVSGSNEHKPIAFSMQRILRISDKELLARSNDDDLYQFTRLRIGHRDSTRFNSILGQIRSDEIKARAIYDRARKLIKADMIQDAVLVYSKIAGLKIADQNLMTQLKHLELRLLAIRNEFISLAKAINKNITFDPLRQNEKDLYTALLTESTDVAKAEKLYLAAGTSNAFFEEGILAAAGFMIRNYPETLKAYELLAEAIQRNSTSIRLLKAYRDESYRKGFDIYAANAEERLQNILKSKQLR